MKTKNYSFFSYVKSNREIKPANVAKIKNSMEVYGFMDGRPILCTRAGEVIDGQHRLEAAKELNIEVVYEFVEDGATEKMIVLNATQTNWALNDYINSYANQNIDCYRKLLKFQEKYKFSMSNSISLFIYGTKSVSNDIRAGKIFTINPYAEPVAEFILNCSHVPYYKEHKFINAINTVFKKLTGEQLRKIKTNLISVPQFSKSGDYIIAFENILNKSKREKDRVKLS